MAPSSRIMNDLFSQKLDSQEGKDKIAEYGGTYIRDRLREVSFHRKIVPPQQITRADCQRSVNHDTLVKIVDVEPQSKAMVLTFRGQPTARFIRAPRAEIPFYTISSEKFEKTEQELLAYEMPITKVIEDNSVKDIQEIEDREFTVSIEAAVQALQLEANGGVVANTRLDKDTIGTCVEFSIRKGALARQADTSSAVALPVQRPDFVNLFKMLDGNRLRAEMVLLTETDWDDILQWTVEDQGNRIQSETLIEGFKYNMLLGRAYCRTIKTDILRPGNIYCFTKPDFFGRFYILNNTKFYIDKIANLITWQAWEDIGSAVINIASVRKLETYSGDSSLNDTQSIVASVTPKAEEDLGAVNNRVDSGLTFPSVEIY